MPAKEGERNAIAGGAFERMQGGKSPMLKDADAAARVSIGNFDDDMGKLSGCD
jgi:hypothetical protein